MYKKIERAATVLCTMAGIMLIGNFLTRLGKVKIYMLTEAGVFLIIAILYTLLHFCKTDNISPPDRTPMPLLVAFIWAVATLLFFYSAVSTLN